MIFSPGQSGTEKICCLDLAQHSIEQSEFPLSSLRFCRRSVFAPAREHGLAEDIAFPAHIRDEAILRGCRLAT
jgi:hypothetical protein